MWDAENDDDAAFERRLDAVVREVGERGKLIVAESVPPVRERAPPPAPAPEPAQAVAPAPARAQVTSSSAAVSMSSRTNAGAAPSVSPPSTVVSQQSGPGAARPGTVSSVEQHPLATQQLSSSASFGASGTGASLMEVSTFMTEQLNAQMAAQRAHGEQLEVQRKEYEAKLDAQREGYEAKLDAQREYYEAQLEAQRKELAAQSEEHMENRRRETEAQAQMSKVTALQLRLEALYDAKLVEDDELSAIEDKVADAIGVANGDANSAWDCVTQMIKLSEGIVSEKMFARQLRRKFA